MTRNRLWLAPLTNLQSHPDGTLSEDEARFLIARAEGGFGLIETCAAYVSPEGKAWPGQLGLDRDEVIPGMRRLTEQIHTAGALACAQLFHGGLRADPKVSGRPRLVASRAPEGDPRDIVEASETELVGVVDAFGRAAARAAEAGFDAVEIHGAHGYLLSQFLSTTYNHRIDGWGGGLEARARLLRSTLRAVRAAAPSLIRCVRLSPEDFGQAKGLDLDESLEVARELVADGLEVLHLSLWRAERTTHKRPEHHPIPLFRAAVGDEIRIVTAGGIWTLEEAQGQLDRGADAVALGRAAIVDPTWPRRAGSREAPLRLPRTRKQLRAAAVGDAFIDYLRGWKGFVAADEGPP